MSTGQILKEDEARFIELENGLEERSFAHTRLATLSEKIYLSVEQCIPICFTAEILPGAMMLFLPDTKKSKYLKERWNTVEYSIIKIVGFYETADSNARVGGSDYTHLIVEVSRGKDVPSSYYLRSNQIFGPFINVPRSTVLVPTFELAPKTETESRSPGYVMRDLSVRGILRFRHLTLRSNCNANTKCYEIPDLGRHEDGDLLDWF